MSVFFGIAVERRSDDNTKEKQKRYEHEEANGAFTRTQTSLALRHAFFSMHAKRFFHVLVVVQVVYVKVAEWKQNQRYANQQ
jgi:hypothetical protein